MTALDIKRVLAGIVTTRQPRLTREAPVLRAATPCRSVDEFVSSFAPFVDDASLFVVTPTPLAVDTDRRFVFQLADGTPVLQGRGRVIGPKPGDEHLSGRTGMRLAFVELTPESRSVHRALLAAQRPTRASSHPNTVPRGGRPSSSPPVEAPSIPSPSGAWEEEETKPASQGEVATLLGRDARDQAAQADAGAAATELAASRTMPANPLAEISEDVLRSFVEYTLHEEGGDFDGERDLDSTDTPRGLDRAVSRRARGTRLGSGALAALSAVVGLGAGYAVWGRGTPPADAAAAPVAAPACAKAASTADLAHPVAVGLPAAPEPAVCRAHIVTVPDGAAVRWGTVDLGTTPLEVTVPCGEAQVALSRRRYARVERTLVVEPGSPAVLSVQMQRSSRRR